MKKRLKSIFEKAPCGERLWKIAVWIFINAASVPAIVQCVFARLFFRDKTLIVCGWARKKHGKVVHNNWGDDINSFFFEAASGRRVLFYPNTPLARVLGVQNFVLIGSIINSYPQRNSIVWGSGLINDKLYKKLPCVPAKILAVRGPLTRKWLLAQGVDCPAIFGDPALLLPRFYTPKKIERMRVGLIPHHADLERGNANVLRLAKEQGVRIIRVQNYAHWQDFIDEICASDFVISASLHGLIVAEAYGVPALWVEFSEHIPGWDFKFRDFYESIGKKHVSPVFVSEKTTMEELAARCSKNGAGVVNADALLACAPFEMSRITPPPCRSQKHNTLCFTRLATACSGAGFFAPCKDEDVRIAA